MTAIKEFLTPKNIAVVVGAVVALGVLDYATGTNVLGWIGEQLAGAEK